MISFLFTVVKDFAELISECNDNEAIASDYRIQRNHFLIMIK